MDFNDILVEDNISIIDALKKLNCTGRRILFVVNKNGKLIASVSDGDIRRWLLNRGKLTDDISELSNKSPISLSVSKRNDADSFMREKEIEVLPLVDGFNKVVDIVYLNFKIKKELEHINIPVVIMAGGKGTRLYPYTKILPKPLIPIGDIPISEHIVNKFREYGCDEFYFIVNYKKNMIKAYFNEIGKDYQLTFVEENEPLGTGGGISLLKGKINKTFILTNSDTIINDEFSKILKEHRSKNNLVTMICSLRNYEVPYGVIEIGENGSIRSMTEKPNMSFFTNTGTYIVEPEVIDTIKRGQYIDFPDIISDLQKKGRKVGVYPINEDSWLDMGQFDTMENMKKKFHVKED